MSVCISNVKIKYHIVLFCFVLFLFFFFQLVLFRVAVANHDIGSRTSLHRFLKNICASSCRGKLSLRWAFVWVNDCANGDEADFKVVQKQKQKQKQTNKQKKTRKVSIMMLTLNCIRGVVPWYPTFGFFGSRILTLQYFGLIIFVIA